MNDDKLTFEVKDRRGEEPKPRQDVLPPEKTKEPTLRCPCCSQTAKASRFLSNPSLPQVLICLQCGNLFMPAPIAREIWKNVTLLAMEKAKEPK